MLKNRWPLICLAMLMAASVAVILLTLSVPPRSGVTSQNIERSVKTGMTRAEVERIFGGGPNDGMGIWVNDDDGSEVWITFDESDRVSAIAFANVFFGDDRTPWEKLLDRLPWRERRRPNLDIE